MQTSGELRRENADAHSVSSSALCAIAHWGGRSSIPEALVIESRVRSVLDCMKRIAGSYGSVRPEMAEGCPEKIDFEFFRYVWTYRQQQRPNLLDYFGGLRADQSLISFSNRMQANDYLREIALKQNRASAH